MVNPFFVAFYGYVAIGLAGALVSVLALVLGKSRLWMPFVIDCVGIADSDLSVQEAEFLKAREQELTTLGFHRVITYRVVNVSRPCVARIWADSTATIVCTAQAMTTSPRWEARFLSMASYGADGSAVTTSNMPAVPIFAAMPQQKTREVVEARSAEALLLAHRAAVEGAQLVAVPQHDSTVFDNVIRRHREFCEFQEKHGVLRRDERRARWIGTLRAHLRVALRQLVPSATDFETAKLIRAVIAGAIVPAVVVLWSYRVGGAWILVAQAAIFASGFIASVFFTARAWPWAIILGALPLLSGQWVGPEPALMLLIGALLGNLVTLRRKGLIAPQPGGRLRMARAMIIGAALALLFVFSYSYFSRQGARRDGAQRTTSGSPIP